MDNNDHNNDSKITLRTIDSNDDNGLIVKLSATFFFFCGSVFWGEKLLKKSRSQVWSQDSSQRARRTTRVCAWPSIQTLGTQLRLWRAK